MIVRRFAIVRNCSRWALLHLSKEGRVGFFKLGKRKAKSLQGSPRESVSPLVQNMKIILRQDWGEHPILSRLGYKSDFDGDGTLHLQNYAPSEFETCRSIVLQVSEDGGETWESSEFVDEVIYIDQIGAGWSWLSSSHPFEELNANTKGRSKAIWRALIAD